MSVTGAGMGILQITEQIQEGIRQPPYPIWPSNWDTKIKQRGMRLWTLKLFEGLSSECGWNIKLCVQGLWPNEVWSWFFHLVPAFCWLLRLMWVRERCPKFSPLHLWETHPNYRIATFSLWFAPQSPAWFWQGSSIWSLLAAGKRLCCLPRCS